MKGQEPLILWLRAAMWVKKKKKLDFEIHFKKLWKYLLDAFIPQLRWLSLTNIPRIVQYITMYLGFSWHILPGTQNDYEGRRADG